MSNTKKPTRSKALLFCAIIITVWMVLSAYILQDALAPVEGLTEAEQTGREIGSALAVAALVPFFLVAGLGGIFTWVSWGVKVPGLALTAGILFSVALFIGASYGIGMIPCIVLAFVGYAMQKKLNKLNAN